MTGGAWLGHFTSPAPIRKLGAIEYVSARAADGTGRVVVTSSADVPAEAARELLTEIARVHRLIDVASVPKVAESNLEGELSWVAFACDAVVDIETLSQTTTEIGYPIHQGGGAGYALAFVRDLQRIHATIDPQSNQPICMGAFASVNVLAGEDGAPHHFGFGHPWRGTARTALLPLVPSSFLAPEAVFGVAPSPGSDVAAVARYFHSFERLGSMPEALAKCFAGDTSAQGLVERVIALVQNTQAPRPADRSMARFEKDFAASAELLGIQPDESAFRADIRSLIAAWRRSTERPPLVVARDGRWCRPPKGDVVQLERRGAMRRLLVALAEARRDTPGDALSWEKLLKSGWPEENPRVDAGKNRVYVTVAQLRSLGLRTVLMSTDAGYMLDPSVPLTFSDGAPEG